MSVRRYYTTTVTGRRRDVRPEDATTEGTEYFYNAIREFESVKNTCGGAILFSVDDDGTVREIVFYDRIVCVADGEVPNFMECIESRQVVEADLTELEYEVYTTFYMPVYARSQVRELSGYSVEIQKA